MPMWTFLSHLDCKKFDLLFLWDPSRNTIVEGCPELGNNFPDLVVSLEKITSHLGYRRIIGFGASAGALPAVCAGIANRWDLIVAVGNEYPQLQQHLISMMVPGGSSGASGGQPRILLYFSEFNKKDHVCALAAQKITNGEIRALTGYKLHDALWEAYQRESFHDGSENFWMVLGVDWGAATMI